jgi:hypothetical protein
MSMTEKKSPAETRSGGSDYRQYLRRVMAIHNEAIRRLAKNENLPAIELAAMFEDIANQYLDISDEIRWSEVGDRPSTVPSSPTKDRGEETQD